MTVRWWFHEHGSLRGVLRWVRGRRPRVLTWCSLLATSDILEVSGGAARRRAALRTSPLRPCFATVPQTNISMTDSTDSHAIIDNRKRKVGEYLKNKIRPATDLSIVSAYFTIYAYQALRDRLDEASSTRFLYGDPRSVSSVDPADTEAKQFGLADQGGIELQRVLAQKPLARQCAAWIKDRVEIRTIERQGFLHGKLYHIKDRDGCTAAITGSSNFTVRGLGLSSRPNVELNLEVRDDRDRSALIQWFDDLWNDGKLSSDVKGKVLAALNRLGKPYAPEFVYYKTLFHVFKDALTDRGGRDGLIHDIHLHDTEIWKRLYEFQKHGATTAINRLIQHNGCIIADSVGLGKTWTALAVMKFFELRNERVLVLCPKKLEDNWIRYAAWAGSKNNIFLKDRLNYTVLAHTDLSRYEGFSGQIDLGSFNWGVFDLVVIDESHNFRNEGRDRTDENGVLRRSRFNRLLEEVIKKGARTKVLMLSATPVNTSLRDLRNQIYLMTEKQKDAFCETLKIADIQTVFAVAQRKFQQWEREKNMGNRRDKDDLIEELGHDFLTLLDAVTIARSRSHICNYYPDVKKQIGGFPERLPPVNLYPTSDREQKLSYDYLHEQIGGFRLSLYIPSNYLIDQSSFDSEKEEHRFDQRDRERWLIGMIRTNLLKRLESSVNSFRLTVEKILDKMDSLDKRIEKWRDTHQRDELDLSPEADEEDDEFVVGKRRQYRLDEINVDKWQNDLREDRENFDRLYRMTKQITPDRDAKLAELIEVLANKIRNPTLDKDSKPNRKLLVFTTFADTATYLYKNLKSSYIREKLGVHIAVITGGDGNASTEGVAKFEEILGRFAPKAQYCDVNGEEIDILIATDCISEGQNLQDCDLVVNYDIHWNPVRLMQRFGRIDRLESRNRQVAMVNFWPTKDLDRYLDLQNRVEARMVLADATATGLDNLLEGSQSAGDGKEAVQGELNFRDQQLLRLRDEALDIDEADDGVSLHDLTLDDFIGDLLTYLQENRAALEAAPFGICAVANAAWAAQSGSGSEAGQSVSQRPVHPGAIFCFKQRTDSADPVPNVLQPYFLLYLEENGNVRFGFQRARQCLALFRTLARGRSAHDQALEDAFDQETDQGRTMDKYGRLIDSAIRDIDRQFHRSQMKHLINSRSAKLTKRESRPSEANLVLVAWLVVSSDSMAGLGAERCTEA